MKIVDAGLLAFLSLQSMAQDYQIKSAGGKLGVLDQQSMKRLIPSENETGTILDLNLVRELPSVLEDPAMLSYFALLNNCQAPASDFRNLQMRRLPNELEFQEIADFYKSKASTITKDAPRRLAFLFQDHGVGNHTEALALGQYNASTSSFPFVNSAGQQVMITYDNSIPARTFTACIGGTPQPVTGAMPRSDRIYPPTYALAFAPLSFTELRMDRESAKAFLERTGSGARAVSVLIEVEILSGLPTESETASRTRLYTVRRSKKPQLFCRLPEVMAFGSKVTPKRCSVRFSRRNHFVLFAAG